MADRIFSVRPRDRDSGVERSAQEVFLSPTEDVVVEFESGVRVLITLNSDVSDP
jgi:hypothetical protein